MFYNVIQNAPMELLITIINRARDNDKEANKLLNE